MFRKYFQDYLRLPPDRIHIYDIHSFEKGISLASFLEKIAKFDEPLVIYYGGHGYRNGWELSPAYKIPYETIVEYLKNHKKPVLFVNDCCFAMALKDHLHKLQCRYLLLGLAPKTREGFNDQRFVEKIIACWKNRHPADPKLWVNNREELSPFILEKCGELLRSGAQLDYLCYPKK